MRIKLHWLILGGMLIGILIGWWLNANYDEQAVQQTALYQGLNGTAELFLRLLKMLVVPLVFFSLIAGMLGMGDLGQLGRLGGRTFLLYMTTSLLAIGTGLFWVNMIGPGVGVDLAVPTAPVDKAVPKGFWDMILGMVPKNFVEAAANFDLIGVIIFSIFFGAFLLPLTGERKQTMVHFIEGGAEVMLGMTRFVISLAPIGIGALIARMVASIGPDKLWELRWYAVTVALSLGTHLLITLPALIYLVTRRNPYRFLRTMSPALLTGFSTASSSGTLGVTMERAERGAGISNRIAGFVLPIGATVNMDGTALYEIVTVLFIAQVHATVDPTFSISVGQQILIVFLGLAVSIGAAGIPHAGLVMMVIILQAVGLPIEYTAVIWTIDRVLDMSRTAVNIASDSSVTLMVAHGEREIDESVM